MMKKMFLVVVSSLMLSVLLFSVSPAQGLLGKGIFNCGGYPRGADYGKDDPNVAGKELLFEWWEIEPEEGQYNFKLIDDAIKPWKDAGKKVALRIMTACNEKNATPMWVFDRCKVNRIDSLEFSSSNIIFPVFWEPKFVKKYSEMVRALAAKFDGNPAIEFVQVGGVGRWEETYVHTENDKMSKRWQQLGYTHDRYISHCKKMADVFMKYFKKTPVLLSISIGGPDLQDPDRKRIGYELADYAIIHHLYLKQNGWGAHYSYTDHEHFSRIFASTRGKTKHIYEQGVASTESWGWEKGTFRSAVNRALLDCPDYLWVYETDLARPEHTEAVGWAAGHLSMGSYRDAGPLWIRLKQFKNSLKNPDFIITFEDEYNGIICSLPRSEWPDKSRPIPATINGVDCKTTTTESPYFWLDIEDSPILQESNRTGRIHRATVDITYWDEGSDDVTLEFNWNGSSFKDKASFAKTNEKRWKTHRVILSNLVFDTKLSTPDPDLRISAAGQVLAVSTIKIDLQDVLWLKGQSTQR